MAFKLDFGIWGEIFAVPAAIVDRHIRLCGAASLKVLLVLLRHGRSRMTLQEIAQIVGLSDADTQDALNYWIASGVIKAQPQGGDTAIVPGHGGGEPAPERAVIPEQAPPVPAAAPEPAPSLPAAPAAEPEAEAQRVVRVSGRPRLTQEAIAQMAQADGEIGALIQEAQALLGGPLSPSATESLVSLHSYGGMPVEAILMVIQYCVSIGKGSARYIETTAYDWMDRGIDTFDKAERHIMELTRAGEAEKTVKKALGIRDRDLTAKEREFAAKWVDRFGYDEAVLTLAYERTVESKGKLSFPYCDGILSRWHEKGIKTPREAVDEMKAPYAASKPDAAAGAPDAARSVPNLPKERFDRAHAELQRRRNEARDIAAQRKEEIYAKLPHVRELDATLARTGFEVSKAVLMGGDTGALMQRLKDQNLSLQKEKEQELVRGGYPAGYLETPYRCKLCEDKGYKPDGSVCDCLRELLK